MKRLAIALLGFCSLAYSSSLTEDAISSVVELERQVECLAKNIYFEARGEPRKGQLAVAHVTVNRTKSDHYPNDVCSVVYQKKQFSWTVDRPKIRNYELYAEFKDMAYSVLQGETKDPTNGALFFHNTSADPGWGKRIRAKIGQHIFY